MTVKAVELLRRDDQRAVSKIARFVLGSDGGVEIVELAPNGKAVAESLIEKGIPGPQFQVVRRDQGELFLRLLKEAFRGSRLWASDVMEMSEADARANR